MSGDKITLLLREYSSIRTITIYATRGNSEPVDIVSNATDLGVLFLKLKQLVTILTKYCVLEVTQEWI
jgi:hypothetical protein